MVDFYQPWLKILIKHNVEPIKSINEDVKKMLNTLGSRSKDCCIPRATDIVGNCG